MTDRIGVLEGHDWSWWRARSTRGETASGSPYGIDELGRLGYEVAHDDRCCWGSEVAGTALARRVETRVDRRIAHVALSLAALSRADVVVSVFEDFGRSYQAVADRAAGRLPPQLVVSCWLAQRAMTDSHRQVRVLSRLGATVGAVTVFSSNQAGILTERLGIESGRIEVVDFGVDTEWYRPGTGPAGRPYVASVGMDLGRDWATLLAAAARLPATQFKVVAPAERFAHLAVPGNVEVIDRLHPEGYRRLLQGAALVVLSTYPLAYPTGQSVMLESYACAAPVVATTSPALSGYLVEGAAVGVAPGDPVALAGAIGRTLADPGREQMGRLARQVAVARFDQRLMWRSVAGILSARFGLSAPG